MNVLDRKFETAANAVREYVSELGLDTDVVDDMLDDLATIDNRTPNRAEADWWDGWFADYESVDVLREVIAAAQRKIKELS